MSPLDEARKTIGERGAQYGDALGVIAELWSVALRREVTVAEVCLLMTLMKLGRQISRAKRDNIVDAIGYLALSMEDKR